MIDNIIRVRISVPVLDSKQRRRIISLLREKGTLSVTDIFIKLRIDQGYASAELSKLKKAGIVTSQEQGKYRYYTLCEERLNAIHAKRESYVDVIRELESCVFVFN